MLLSRVNNVRVGRSACAQLRRLRLLATTQAQAPAGGGAGAGPVVLRHLAGEDRGIALYGLSSAAKRNTLGHDMVQAMREVNRLLRDDTKVSVVILHSLVPGIFCAGTTLGYMSWADL